MIDKAFFFDLCTILPLSNQIYVQPHLYTSICLPLCRTPKKPNSHVIKLKYDEVKGRKEQAQWEKEAAEAQKRVSGGEGGRGINGRMHREKETERERDSEKCDV